MPEKKKILLVDDEEYFLQMLRLFLEEEYFVELARNGEEAVLKARAERPDLILLDIGIPKLRGDLVAMRLKGQADTTNIPIIMVTAIGDIQEMAFASDIGVADYVEKPFENVALLEKIKDTLAKSCSV